MTSRCTDTRINIVAFLIIIVNIRDIFRLQYAKCAVEKCVLFGVGFFGGACLDSVSEQIVSIWLFYSFRE
jgi:hypothetical protein